MEATVKVNSKKKILITDDSEMNRSILIDMLEGEFEILEAADGKEAVSMLQKYHTSLDLLLLDIVMPQMDGLEVLAVMNQNHWIENVPVIMISAETSSALIERSYELGVTDFINRPFDMQIVRRRVQNTIMLFAKQKKLQDMVADQIYEKEKSSSLMVSILSHIVEFRNGESGLHVLHINTLTELLLGRLMQKTDKYGLTQADISLITMASSLHDIGKIAIPEEILNKPGRFTPEEFEVMKSHSAAGASMMKNLPFHQEEPLVKVAYEICRWHHERYDGRGYPDGLKGDNIPISAQIVSLADVYDALTSVRVYKAAYTHEQAMQMILNGECGTFNPLLLECLSDMEETIRREMQVNSISFGMRRTAKRTIDAMYNFDETSASARTLYLLERERMKYQLFSAMSNEIQFEYTREPAMIIISQWGAQRLGISETIVDPSRSPEILSVFQKEDVNKFVSLMCKATPQEPQAKFDCLIRISGELRWHRIYMYVLWQEENQTQYSGAIGKAVDIHEEYQKIMGLQKKVYQDSLTQVWNQKYGSELITQRLEETEDSYALMLVDIDCLKEANQKHGLLFGDQILQKVAESLAECVKGEEILLRVRGDEFLLMVQAKEDLKTRVSEISRTLDSMYEDFHISASIGVAETSPEMREYAALLECAVTALGKAKENGRGSVGFCS